MVRAMVEVALSAIHEPRLLGGSELCPRCGGKGIVADEADWCGIEEGGSIQCPTCRGTGSVPRPKGASPETIPPDGPGRTLA